MTLVRINLRQAGPDGDQPAVGDVTCTPYQRVHVDAPADGDTDYYRTAAPYVIRLVDGTAEVDLHSGVWVIKEYLSWGGEVRVVQVPDSDQVVDYGDLPDFHGHVVEQDQPAHDDTPSGAVDELRAQVEQLTARVDALSTRVDSVDAVDTELTVRINTLEVQTQDQTGRDSQQDTAIADLAADIDQLAAVAATPNGMRSSWRWTTVTTPSAGKITATDTSVSINSLDGDSIDLSNALDKINTGSVLYAQARADASIWRRWTITAPATISGNVYRFPAELEGAQGRVPSNNTWLVVAFTRPPVDD